MKTHYGPLSSTCETSSEVGKGEFGNSNNLGDILDRLEEKQMATVLHERLNSRLFWLVVLIGIVMLSVTLHVPMPRQPLDSAWEEHMLSGLPANYVNGQSLTDIPTRTFETAKGRVSEAWLTKEGIAFSDRRETSLFGLLRRGGWALYGGLLGKVEINGSTIELYGKHVVRERPVLWFFLHWGIPGGFGYEFFLLHRRKGVTKAEVVKKWTFNRFGILQMIIMDWPKDVRGLLFYDRATRTATVTILGFTEVLQESIDMSNRLGQTDRKKDGTWSRSVAQNTS